MQITRMTLATNKLTKPVRVAIASDLHDRYDGTLTAAIEDAAPDLVAVPGDVVHGAGATATGLEFLKWSAARYPTFVSLGNHEWKCKGDIRSEIEKTGARLLDNDFLPFGELTVGGLSSGYEGREQGRFKRTPEPETAWLDTYEVQGGFKLLLCHHPEYYRRHLRDRAIDLTLAGHAHVDGVELDLRDFAVFCGETGHDGTPDVLHNILSNSSLLSSLPQHISVKYRYAL